MSLDIQSLPREHAQTHMAQVRWIHEMMQYDVTVPLIQSSSLSWCFSHVSRRGAAAEAWPRPVTSAFLTLHSGISIYRSTAVMWPVSRRHELFHLNTSIMFVERVCGGVLCHLMLQWLFLPLIKLILLCDRASLMNGQWTIWFLIVSKLHFNQSLLSLGVSGYSERKARRGCSISVLRFPSRGALTVCGHTVSVQQLLLPCLMRPPFSPVALIGCYIYWWTKTPRKEGEGKKRN